MSKKKGIPSGTTLAGLSCRSLTQVEKEILCNVLHGQNTAGKRKFSYWGEKRPETQKQRKISRNPHETSCQQRTMGSGSDGGETANSLLSFTPVEEHPPRKWGTQYAFVLWVRLPSFQMCPPGLSTDTRTGCTPS